MIRGLIEKELRQSRLTLLLILLVLGTGLVMIMRADAISRMGGSVFDAVRYLVAVFMPLCCIVLSHSLVAGEFRQRAQLFLEGLPLPRWRMLAVKYGLGLLMVALASMMLLGACWWKAKGGELMTQRFLELMATKLVCWAAFCWSLAFALGFLGRYRLVVTLTIVIGLLFAESQGVLISRFGPFDLIGQRFAFERFVWPEKSLWITGGVIAGSVMLGFFLGLMRDASLATLLAEKMSAREKVTIGLLAVVAMMSIGFVQMHKEEAGPVHLPGSVDVKHGAATVSVAAAVADMTPEEKTALETYAHATAEWLDEAAQWLHREDLPTLFLVHRRDFEKEQLEDGSLDSRQGYMLRLNFLEHQPQDIKLKEKLLTEVLRAANHYRQPSDQAGWVLDGFVYWWLRRAPATPAKMPNETTGKGQPAITQVSANDLRHWFKLSRKLGAKKSAPFAGKGINVLNANCGEAKLQRFISAVLGHRVPHDARAWIYDVLHPVGQTLEQTTGLTLDQLAQKWTAALGKAKEVTP